MNWHKKHRWILKLLSDLMTPEEREQQRRDFAYYNVKLSNPNVTREMVDDAAERMENPMTKIAQEIATEIQTEPPEHLKGKIAGHAEIARRQNPSNKKPTYKLVDGEPVCVKNGCPCFEKISHMVGLCNEVGFSINVVPLIDTPCIPGLREQRDELKKEKERLELELNKWETETVHEGPNTHAHPITPEFAGRQLRRAQALEKENEQLRQDLDRALKPWNVTVLVEDERMRFGPYDRYEMKTVDIGYSDRVIVVESANLNKDRKKLLLTTQALEKENQSAKVALENALAVIYSWAERHHATWCQEEEIGECTCGHSQATSVIRGSND